MANLIRCSDCGGKISPKAAACPKCGSPVPPSPPVAPLKPKSNVALKLIAVFLGLSILAKLIGGHGPSSTTASVSPAPAPALPSGQSVTLRQGDFGSAWPYTVPELTFHCDRNPNVPTMLYDVATFNGTTYSFDGLAQSFAAQKGYHPMEEIWKDNPDVGGTKMPISDIVKRTSGLCTGKQ